MNILDPKFKYRPSYDTDIRRTFARLKKAAPKAAAPISLAEQRRQIREMSQKLRERKHV